RFPAGVAFADLAAVQDATTVWESIASSLGPFRQASLEAMAAIVNTAGLLLVIDNAEHLVEAVSSAVEGLLARCPNLWVVVTSREPLNIGGETSWPVPPLQVPPHEARRDAAALGGFGAVALVLVRARAHVAGSEVA